MNMNKLDRVIKEIWINELQKDFRKGLILNEDTLKNALYFHLRTHFGKDDSFKDLLIFTECNNFGFSDISHRPDLIIAKKNIANEPNYKDKKVLAVFELKYKSSMCYAVESEIYNDLHKMKDYKSTEDFKNCQFYNMAITLGDFNRPNWLDKKATNNWAKGCVTELNAYEPNGILEFQIYSYNGMNEDLNTEY